MGQNCRNEKCDMGSHPRAIVPTSQQTVLAPSGAEDFQDGGDNGKAEIEPASNSEVDSQPQSTEDDGDSGGEEESEDASGDRPECTEDKSLAAEWTNSTSAEDDGKSGGEWTTNRAKEAKRGPVCLEVGGESAPAPSFLEQ